MNDPTPSVSRLSLLEGIVFAARLILGGVFVYLGLNKALHPVDFLKILRQYELIENHVLLNFIAAALPWFEIVCGLLLLGGIGVRGSALMLLVMLVPFSLLILERALDIHAAGGIAFCAIRFDCGCGTGEVVVCHKLLENAFFILLSILLLAGPVNRWCLRANLAKSR